MCIAVKKTEGGKSADQKVGAGVGEVDEEAPLLQSSSPEKTGRVKPEDADNLTAFIIFWFSTPSVQLGSFSADPFSIDVSATNPKITAHWNITFFFTNPYGSGRLIYRKLDAEVFYKNAFLGGAFIDPFVQQPEETKLVLVVVVASPTVVSNQIAKAIDAEKSTTGAVSFNVKIQAILRMKGGWEWIFSGLKKYEVSVDCEKLKVPFNSSNTTATAGSISPGGPRKCFFQWK
ncbi:NDR1/HIN1-like protein 10 [Prunus avium]|uniref:NDR1/HIN1-like protein 10 n=1 Tax=Prunus avium TaxID=42229 RepID=A0A6P5SP78_PRUAV|nr:NDR1/HIN1-like protein 10 [Prunus avium]